MTRLSLLLACLLLAACGQKGPLYLPTQKPPITPGAEYRPQDSKPAPEEEKQDEAKAAAANTPSTP